MPQIRYHCRIESRETQNSHLYPCQHNQTENAKIRQTIAVGMACQAWLPSNRKGILSQHEKCSDLLIHMPIWDLDHTQSIGIGI